jgi:hypothetical protein
MTCGSKILDELLQSVFGCENRLWYSFIKIKQKGFSLVGVEFIVGFPI